MVMHFGIDPVLSSLLACPQVRDGVPRDYDQGYEAYEEEENAAECKWHRLPLPMNLVLVPTGILTVGVPFTNSAVASMNQQLSLIPSRDIACSEPGFCLRAMNRSCTSISGYLDAPSALTWHNVYVSLGHGVQVPKHDVLETNPLRGRVETGCTRELQL
jgi:hypothetical protein